MWHPKKINQTKQHGLSLTELLVSISLLGALTSLTLPMLINNVGEEKLVSTVQGTAGEISKAYTLYAKETMPSLTTPADAIVAKMNYVRIINDSSASIQVDEDGDSGTPATTSTCDAATPCVLLQGGALLQYEVGNVFDGVSLEPNRNGMPFLVDPDGSSDQVATQLVLFLSGRISTRQWTTGGSNPAFINSVLPDPQTDPEYVQSWTNG